MRVCESRLTCIEETWWFSERWLSRVTPRVLTVLDIGITEPEMLTDETGGNDAERCLVENQMAGLSARPLKQNQWCN